MREGIGADGQRDAAGAADRGRGACVRHVVQAAQRERAARRLLLRGVREADGVQPKARATLLVELHLLGPHGGTRRLGGIGLGAALGCGGGAVEQHGFHAARVEARMLAHEIGVVVVGVHERPARALRQRAQKLGLGARDVLAAAQKLDMALAHVHHEAPIGAHVVA